MDIKLLLLQLCHFLVATEESLMTGILTYTALE